MGHFHPFLTFEHRGYLLLLVLVPAVVLLSLRSLVGLGPVRQALAIGLRAVVLVLIIAALADARFVRRNDRLTVMFVLDDSLSVPQEKRKGMIQYINEAVHRKPRSDDQAGVISFARTPRIEVPPSRGFELMRVESLLDRQYTDLAAALRLALAAFPENTAKRIVVVSDGNENQGNARDAAGAARAMGVPIDVLPIEYRYDDEVMVEKVSVPPDANIGETVNITVIIRAGGPSAGVLRVFKKARGESRVFSEQRVQIKRGLNAFTVPWTVDRPAFYTFEALFDPDPGGGDRLTQNNRASGFSNVKGSARILFIDGHDDEHPAAHAHLIDVLERQKMDVEVVQTDQVPKSLTELRPYDSVILANVPRDALDDTQVKLLERNTHELGAGLVMIGGSMSFGLGGWNNTPVEKALPVTMDIKALKVQGQVALVMVMHATEIAQGNYWMKVIAKDAVKALTREDEVGVLHWSGTPAWHIALAPIGNRRNQLLARIDQLMPGDMPDFESIVSKAVTALSKSNAFTRHIIVISDGDPAPPSPMTLSRAIKARITITTVAVAAHGGDYQSRLNMKKIAQYTRGRYYEVGSNGKDVKTGATLPQIYQKEVRLIARSVLYERNTPWNPRIQYSSEILGGLSQLPPMRGFVMTTPKDAPALDPVVSPLPAESENPLLASWIYGLGKSVAFTGDSGARWMTDWVHWPGYAPFWKQVITWSLRSAERGNFTVVTRRQDGQIQVIVDALDKDNQFLNDLNIRGTILGPNLKSQDVPLAQTAPGRYEGTVDGAQDAGTYFATLRYTGPGGEQGILSSGVNVPYSAEFAELESNRQLLEDVALVSGGQVINPALPWRTDVFRHDLPPSTSSQETWPLLLFDAVLLFLADVAVRRIAPDFSWVGPLAARVWAAVRGRAAEERPAEYLEKLRSRKAEVDEQLERTRAATRFEPPAEPMTAPGVTEPTTAGPPPKPRPSKPEIQPSAAAEDEGYTSRLLKAKKRVWEDRDKP